MGRAKRVRNRVALWVVSVMIACLAIGSTAGLGSPRRAYAGGPSACKSRAGEVVTLRLKVPVQTVGADVGDTIKVVVSIPGGYVNSPHSDSGQAVCRISTHRVSPSKVIATFRAQRAKTRVTFRASGDTSSKGCPPHSHGCPRPARPIGYLKIRQ